MLIILQIEYVSVNKKFTSKMQKKAALREPLFLSLTKKSGSF